MNNKDEIKRLYQTMYEMDKQFERNKFTRYILSVLLFAAERMVYLCMKENPTTIVEITGCMIAALVWGGFSNWLCLLLFTYMFNKSQSENSAIKYIKERISALEKTNLPRNDR